MKTELLKLFATTPVLADKPAAFLETLVEDVQATIIKALALPVPARIVQAVIANDELEFQNDVDDLWISPLGIQLTTLLTLVDYPHKENVSPAQRTTIVKAMLGTLLLEMALAGVDNAAQGAVLRGRLKELETPSKIVVH